MQFCRSSAYCRAPRRKYLNGGRENCTDLSKCSQKGDDRYIILVMKHVYAGICRTHRHPEGSESLLTSRGRAMAQTLKAQSFNWVATDPQEVPSTA